MAEKHGESSQEENCQPGQQVISIGGASAAFLMEQSKSEATDLVEFREVQSPEEGKNKLCLICEHCKCQVMRPGYGKLVEKEVGWMIWTPDPSDQIFMPHVTEKYKIGSEPAGDTPTKFWLVDDMFHFENIGFSKTVDSTVKYLICADCEIGPIGWHDIRKKTEFYVAAERVKYATA